LCFGKNIEDRLSNENFAIASRDEGHILEDSNFHRLNANRNDVKLNSFVINDRKYFERLLENLYTYN